MTNNYHTQLQPPIPRQFINCLLRVDTTATIVIFKIISIINKEEVVKHYLTSRAAAPVMNSVLYFTLGLFTVSFQKKLHKEFTVTILGAVTVVVQINDIKGNKDKLQLKQKYFNKVRVLFLYCFYIKYAKQPMSRSYFFLLFYCHMS